MFGADVRLDLRDEEPLAVRKVERVRELTVAKVVRPFYVLRIGMLLQDFTARHVKGRLLWGLNYCIDAVASFSDYDTCVIFADKGQELSCFT